MRSLGKYFIVGALAAAGTLAAPAALRAEQFILFDAKFTYTKQDADTATPNKSHYYITAQNPINKPNPARPTNWLSPVDYRNGSVHVRTEVIDKPAGSEITQWWLCYIANKGVPGTDGYGCTGTGTYKEEGVYDRDDTMTAWWNNTAIDWTQGIRQIDLVMKDFGTGNGGNYTHLRPDPEHFFPTTVRITAIQVAKGSTYDPSLVPNVSTGNGPDGGATADAARDAAAETDPTAGGTGGATGDTDAAVNGTGGGRGGGGLNGAGTGGTSSSGAAGSAGGQGTGGRSGAGAAVSSSGCALAGAAGSAGHGPDFLFVGASAAIAALRRRRRHPRGL
ncbi:MAG TPA: hypothetical protein VNO55_28230 [Polyangia bacterium]|nr:hypothetical protein [Polyangia bacterium]